MSAVWAHDLLREIYLNEATPKPLRSSIRARLQPVEVDYRGCRMHVHPADNNTEFQIWKHGRTQEERPLKRILSRLEGRPVYAFDVGANAGSFATRIAAVAGEGAQIHAFEPNPIMRSRLEKNIDLNGFTSIAVHDCAVSNEEGDLTLHIPDIANFGQARLYEKFEGGRDVPVRVMPLSSFAPTDPGRAVDFLKVDIEGFEDRVIVPYLDTVAPSQHPHMIFFEHKHKALWIYDLDAALARHGYRMEREFGRNALFVKAE